MTTKPTAENFHVYLSFDEVLQSVSHRMVAQSCSFEEWRNTAKDESAGKDKWNLAVSSLVFEFLKLYKTNEKSGQRILVTVNFIRFLRTFYKQPWDIHKCSHLIRYALVMVKAADCYLAVNNDDVRTEICLPVIHFPKCSPNAAHAFFHQFLKSVEELSDNDLTLVLSSLDLGLILMLENVVGITNAFYNESDLQQRQVLIRNVKEYLPYLSEIDHAAFGTPHLDRTNLLSEKGSAKLGRLVRELTRKTNNESSLNTATRHEAVQMLINGYADKPAPELIKECFHKHFNPMWRSKTREKAEHTAVAII